MKLLVGDTCTSYVALIGALSAVYLGCDHVSSRPVDFSKSIVALAYAGVFNTNSLG
ncbi:Uncharacterised protein [Segatella copri]|nr:Uncharacterised protein [Segatella copri]